MICVLAKDAVLSCPSPIMKRLSACCIQHLDSDNNHVDFVERNLDQGSALMVVNGRWGQSYQPLSLALQLSGSETLSEHTPIWTPSIRLLVMSHAVPMHLSCLSRTTLPSFVHWLSAE